MWLTNCCAFVVPHLKAPRRGASLCTTSRARSSRSSTPARARSGVVLQAAGASSLSVALGAVSRLVAICGVGAAYAKAGVLDGPACATLSRLIYFAFQPAMLFVNCATTVAM